MADMRARWPEATYVEAPREPSPLGRLPPSRGAARRALHMIGAPFQIKVWEALLAIPSGHVTTYSEIAVAIGNPRAVRAVGTCGGAQPGQLSDPLPPGLAQIGGIGRLSLGPAGETRHPRLGKRARRPLGIGDFLRAMIAVSP